MEANVTPHDDRSRQADRHQAPEPDQDQPRDGLPRDTVREVCDNTLRGLQPGPDDPPSSSRPSPVIVPSQDDPEPVSADRVMTMESRDPDQPNAHHGTGRVEDEDGPRLVASSVTMPPEWYPKPRQQDANKVEYSAPQAAPEATDHKTIETATVKLDPDVDPRKQITERKLKRPPAQSEARQEAATPREATARPSRRPIAMALVVGIAAVVVAIVMGLHSRARRQVSATPSAGALAETGHRATVAPDVPKSARTVPAPTASTATGLVPPAKTTARASATEPAGSATHAAAAPVKHKSTVHHRAPKPVATAVSTATPPVHSAAPVTTGKAPGVATAAPKLVGPGRVGVEQESPF